MKPRNIGFEGKKTLHYVSISVVDERVYCPKLKRDMPLKLCHRCMYHGCTINGQEHTAISISCKFTEEG